MRALSASDVIEIWEMTTGAGSTELALAILARAVPEHDVATLAALPLGRRDACLLTLYRDTFGPALDLFVRCPACGEGLELDVDADDLLAGAPMPQIDDSTPTEHELREDGLELRYRLPSTDDLIAAATAADEMAARDLLLARLVHEARREGELVAITELDPAERQRLDEAIAAADPLAEITFDLVCESCRHRWQALCDIADCFAHRLATTARLLLREVHLLARGYGWRESEILALAPPRRRVYLEMLTGD